jgi:hypothetical protein
MTQCFKYVDNLAICRKHVTIFAFRQGFYLLCDSFIQTSHHSAVGHRASTRILHLTLFLASVLISAQVFLTPLGLFKHRSSPCVPRSPPAPFALAIQLLGLAWLCHRAVFAVYGPAIPHLRFLICKFILGCFVRFHSSVFVI